MAGFSSLSNSSFADTVIPTTVVVTGGVVAYLVLTSIYRKVLNGSNPDVINKSINKDKAKVAHSFDIEDLPDKVAYCRCWKSKKFPYCDGSHNAHNKLTGDNVGPVCLKKKFPEK